MKIYLATWLLESSQGQSMTAAGSRNRLLSYWHTKEQPDGVLAVYCETGTTPDPEQDEDLSGRA